MTTGESTTTTTTVTTTVSAPATAQTSPWHSPIPYLFGGLAAMLGLIAIALLLLACSYRQRRSGGEENGGSFDVESGASAAEKGESTAGGEAPPVFEDKVLVIMAGEMKPTFLATPKDFSGMEGIEEFGERKVEAKAADS